MRGSGSGRRAVPVNFDPQFFEDLLTSEKVGALCDMHAEAVAEVAKRNAPVDTGEYRDGIEVKRARRHDRVVTLVIGTDWKTMLVESQTGNLGKAIREVMR